METKQMETISDLDAKMLQLFEELKKRGVLKYKRAFCAAMGLPEQNINNIINGKNHFNLIHVFNICRFYGINANWIFETEDNLFISKPYKKTVTQMLHKTGEKQEI
jgi:plasmid maintenance system antidote protein VapI